MIKIIDNREEKKITEQDLPCFFVGGNGKLYYLFVYDTMFNIVAITDDKEETELGQYSNLETAIEEGDKKVDVKIEIGG